MLNLNNESKLSRMRCRVKKPNISEKETNAFILLQKLHFIYSSCTSLHFTALHFTYPRASYENICSQYIIHIQTQKNTKHIHTYTRTGSNGPRL